MTFSVTVWFDKATKHDLTKLSSVIRQCQKIIGTSLPSLEELYIQRLIKKTQKILNDEHHPANNYFNFLPSGRRLRHFKGNSRFLRSTYPQAVRLFNNSRINRYT